MAKHSPITSLEPYTQEVNRYLKSVPVTLRDEEVRELRGHLEQLTADLHIGGRSETEAVQLAIGRFGEARTVGVKLRDVWEGNHSTAATLFTTVLSNWLLQLANLALFLAVVLAIVTYNDRLIEPLKPLFAAWMWGTVLPAPFVWNYLLGQWGGRRVAFAALLAFAPLVVAGSAYEGSSTLVTIGSLSLPSAPLACSLMGFCAGVGGWQGSLAKQRQRWALVGDAPREHASMVLRRRPPVRLLPVLTVVGILVAVGWSSFKVFGRRVELVLYPQTPEAAVRVFLSAPGYAYSANLTNISATAIEIKPRPFTAKDIWQYPSDVKQRLAYTVTFHYKQPLANKPREQSAQPHIALYDSLIRAACLDPRDSYMLPRVRAELAKLQAKVTKLPPRSSFTVHGEAIVVNTPEGWKMDNPRMKQSWIINS